MGLYSDLSDDEIRAEIADIRGKLKDAILGGEIELIAGEGRQMKARLLNIDEAKGMLADLQRELTEPERTGVPRRGRALSVRILSR